MRHNITSIKRAAPVAGTNGRDRAAEDVAGMHDDELIEIVGSYPQSDAPDAGRYFELAVIELAARIDRRQAVPAGA